MKEITKEELKEIKGGTSLTTIGIGVGVSLIISFIIGIINGYTNPTPCGGKEWKKFQKKN